MKNVSQSEQFCGYGKLNSCKKIMSYVVFVLDRSGSIYYEDFYEAVDFLYNVTKWLTIGSSTDELQISVVTFSNSVTEEFDLNDYTSKTDLLDAIEAVKSRTPSGQTYTHDALDFCYSSTFTSGHGSRSGVPKAVVVLTDGISTETSETSTQASILQNAGIEVYAIGIGSVVTSSMTELESIASDPDSYYVNTVGTFSNLCLLVPELVVKLDSNVLESAVDKCGVFNTTSTEDTSGTDNTPLYIAAVSGVAATAAVIGGIGVGIAKALAAMKMSAKIPTMLSAVGMYTQAPLGPAKAKFTTKFIQSGIPTGQMIPSKAPAQTFSPRSIASITLLD
ncbi:COL6A [Mytilus coruscus]|uniref:COL6A n=1 Tax=Mytilus coruscus TaxID=42192 RepID=A0A6J7ZX69_MYTCO|nr:COL6A [Mytilus coruscus]